MRIFGWALLCAALLTVRAGAGEAESDAPETPEAPLPLELPEPVFGGTPYDGPNIFGPDEGLPRPPFLVPEGTVLLSRGKPVSSNVPTPRSGTLSQITDGNKGPGPDSRVDLGPGVPWIQIDLGAEHELAAIVMWKYPEKTQIYMNVIVQVSNDPFFKEGVTTLFNNDRKDELYLGAGQDYNYMETHEGKLIDAKGLKARYLRSYSSGSIYSGMDHYVEVEAWGKPTE
ncbi:MAG: hypothetical protein GC168_01420 [Candidatus Hydrogenedens sp.]|nr:hypothetical protein [Candidatus Hydrogenedens sp.]